MESILKPKFFIVGILSGFILCCMAGYIAAKNVYYENFKRFFAPILLEHQYYPTAHELLMTARHAASHDKILVLVGGSSILRGHGQNINELWSNELQNLLGKSYKVLNYGMNAATMNSFGGVAFLMLNQEYKKIIFVTHSQLLNLEGPIDGFEAYRYLFWDAYYKNLLNLNKEEHQKISLLRSNEIKTMKGLELHIMSLLDSYFYFRNLWNWVGYNYFFTVWTDEAGLKFFKPRSYFSEKDFPFKKFAIDYAKLNEPKEAFVKNFSNLLQTYFDFSKANLTINNDVLTGGRKSYDEAFPSRLRSKIICLLFPSNARNVKLLPYRYQQAYKLVIEKSNQTLKELGFNSIVMDKNLLPEDYVDEAHLLPYGGNKIAEEISKEVRYVANANHYYPKFGS